MRSLTRLAAAWLVCGLAGWACAADAPPKGAPPDTPEDKLPASYYAEMARVKSKFGRHAEAIELFKTAIAKEKDTGRRADHIEHYARALARAGRGEAAAEQLVSAIDQAKDTHAKRMLLGSLAAHYESIKQYDKAAAAYEKLIAATDDPWRKQSARRRLLRLYQRGGKTDAIIAELQKKVAADPKDAASLRQLAELYHDLKRDNANALACYEKLAQLVPDDLNVLKRLADLYAGAKQTDKVLALCEKLAKADPRHRASHCERAIRTLARAGKKDQIGPWAKRMTDDKAGDPHACTRLADLYIGLGMTKEALAVCDTAIAKSQSASQKEFCQLQKARVARQAKDDQTAEVILRDLVANATSKAVQIRAKSELQRLQRARDRGSRRRRDPQKEK